MKGLLGQVLLPLLFMGACSFPKYSFTESDAGSRAGASGSGGDGGGANEAGDAGSVSAECSDGVQGPNETGKDCGGVCKACATHPSPCGDGVQGADETGIDCGGLCPVCGAGSGCNSGKDCESAQCLKSICQAATCSDQIRNGTESDTDCGGGCVVLCKTGLHCNTPADCETGSCSGNKCQPASCDDRVANGTETGVDCGGTCAPCKSGEPCLVPSDCQSSNCDASKLLCVDTGCTDKTKNGDETDTDCGGSCAPCAPKGHCKINTDCDSSICDSSTKLCEVATCSDGVQNQGESDTDCGAGVCKTCAVSKKCRVATDCATGVCQTKVCVPPAATGAPLPTGGWVVTASSTFGSSATKNMIDGVPSVRWTSGTSQYAGMWVLLDLAKPQIFFSISLDCTTAEFANDYGKLYNVYVSNDGTNFGTVKSGVVGKGFQTFTFDTAVVTRFVKIELQAGDSNWWSIGELYVYQ